MTNQTFAVYHTRIQNLDEVYACDADAVFSEPELAYTCDCADEDEVIAFNRFLDGAGCDPSLDIVIKPVIFKSEVHYHRDDVKSQLMRAFATLADINGIDRARSYGDCDLVTAALAAV